MAHVLISLLSYNHSRDTIECLKKIDTLVNNGVSYDILLIENGSVELEKKILHTYIKENKKYKLVNSEFELANCTEKYIYLNLDQNCGFSGGHNLSFKYVRKIGKYDYVWVLNNDTLPDKNSLKELVDFSETKSPCITGSVIMEYENKEVIQDLGTKSVSHIKGYKAAKLSDSKDGKSISVHAVCGASMLINASIINKKIIFDDKFYFYVEENEFGYRCSKLGIESHIVLNSIVYHKGSVVLNKESSLKLYYLIRNLLYLKNKHFSKISVIFSIIHLGLMALYKHKFSYGSINAYLCAVYDFFKGNMGKTLRVFREY